VTAPLRRATAVVLVAALVGAAGRELRAGLTGAEALARIYDLILDARFEQAAAPQGCADAPPEACTVLDAVTVWWRIQLDPRSRTLDAAFLTHVNGAIAATEAWTVREPSRAEAWFYLGAAYATRVQWRVLRNEKLAAARDGKRIKESLERAVAIDPKLEDAYFGIGMYQYYADVAPAAARFLRWLLLLPGGDRARGLQQMLRTREHGVLLRGEADFQLQTIYLWYENQPLQALTLLERLHAKYPGNPLFALHIADVQDGYFHDLAASLDTYSDLLEAVQRRRVNEPGLAEAAARLGMARQLDALFETDRAIDQLETLIADNPAAPYGVTAEAQLLLGRARARLGQSDLATTAYRAAIAGAPSDDPARIREQARAALRRAPDTRAAQAYRLSLEGLRALERKRLVEADAALEQSLELRPADPVTRYRYGRVLLARHDDARALTEFERVIATRPATPPTILAGAFLEAARLVERSGQRTRAIDLYERAAAVRGGAADTRTAATRALARLRPHGADARR
jgi:predicted Zn-dependent protease